jgi:hypothetical protein
MQKNREYERTNAAPLTVIEQTFRTTSQAMYSRAQERNDKKARIKPKRPTGLPVSLEGSQKDSHDLASVRPCILTGCKA